MARPIPRLEPVTRMVSLMGFFQVARHFGRAKHVETGLGMDAGAVEMAFEHAHAVVVLQGALGANPQFAAEGKVLDAALVVARAEQEAQFDRQTGLACLTASEG